VIEQSNGPGIGSDFVGYRIEDVIGRGGMGVVYRAYDLRLKRTVALKLMAPELALDEGFRLRFARETELAMALEHPNVVPVHDAGDVDGRLYLAMRLVEGADLRALLRKERRLEPARALAICRQIANALDAAHAKGLIHRDVKPSNVLLDPAEHVYLADFGLTRRLDEQGAQPGDSRSIGTPAYLAPEQIEGGAVDGRADLYALACVLFECLTGKPPYGGSSRLETAWAHLEEAPPRASSLGELPEGIDRVFDVALAKNPDDRYPTCSALMSAAEEALGLRRSQPFRRPRVLLLAAALIIALASGVAFAATRATGGQAKAGVPLFAGPDTLARIDPKTNRVSAVVAVGAHPVVAAAAGHSVWVYNRDGASISEVDARTNRVVKTSPVSSYAPAHCCSLFAGPVLAADASGAWFVSGGDVDKPRLTHIRAGAGRKLEYPLDLTPTGVATGRGAVWVVGHRGRDYRLLRIDPVSGRVTARTPFPSHSRVDSIAFGYGAVYVMSSSPATLYRIDPRSARRTGSAMVAHSRATRPEITRYLDNITVRTTEDGGTDFNVDPVVLIAGSSGAYGPPDWGEYNGDLGALWWYNWPSGTVSRQQSADGPITDIHVTAGRTGDPCLTSMTAGSGSLWVTAAALPDPNGGPCIR
jgi:serine/threonine-protein kinase